MSAALKPYPVMKDSGVPWLGDVPEHWGVRRLKYLLRERDQRSIDGSEQLLRVSQYTGVTERSDLGDSNIPESRAESLVGYKLVRRNDIVVNIMLAWNGSMGVSPFAGITSPAYCIYRFSASAHPWYFHHLLRSPLYKARIKAVSTGVVESRLRLYSDDLFRLETFVPPLAEQAAIVRFLDYADRRIRRYICAKQQLIKLLEEQRQAIIDRAITCGINANVGHKPSGVEWLGGVPKHRQVVRLGRFVELVTGFAFKSDGFTQDAEDVKLLRGVNVSPGRIRWVDVVRWPKVERNAYKAFELRTGDIVLGMDRPIIQGGTRVATVSESDVPALLVQRVARIRPADKISSEFLALLLTSKLFADYLAPIFTGVSVPHLSPEQIKGFRFALPSDNEQREILQWVAQKTGETSGAVVSAKREIEFLQEYRTRLIADVVTGKLDVREAAAQLPDEAEESELLEEVDAERDAEEVEITDPDAVPEEAEA